MAYGALFGDRARTGFCRRAVRDSCRTKQHLVCFARGSYSECRTLKAADHSAIDAENQILARRLGGEHPCGGNPIDRRVIRPYSRLIEWAGRIRDRPQVGEDSAPVPVAPSTKRRQSGDRPLYASSSVAARLNCPRSAGLAPHVKRLLYRVRDLASMQRHNETEEP